MPLKIADELSKLLEKIKSSKPYLSTVYKMEDKKQAGEEKNGLISNPEINCILNVRNRNSQESAHK